jgi:hypothetical protein
METSIVTLPAYWASALINGDTSGMDDSEIADMERELEGLSNEGWNVVDVARGDDGEVDEPRFTWSFGLYGGNASGGDVLDYVIIRDSR